VESENKVHPIVIFVVMVLALFIFGALFTMIGHPWLTIFVLVAYFVWGAMLNKKQK